MDRRRLAGLRGVRQRASHRAAGRQAAAPANDGAGLWLANQLTDLVQIRSTPDGTEIRVYQKL